MPKKSILTSLKRCDSITVVNEVVGIILYMCEQKIALIVDGTSLESLFQLPDLKKRFTDAVRCVPTVIACRLVRNFICFNSVKKYHLRDVIDGAQSISETEGSFSSYDQNRRGQARNLGDRRRSQRRGHDPRGPRRGRYRGPRGSSCGQLVGLCHRSVQVPCAAHIGARSLQLYQVRAGHANGCDRGG
jgi:hypothetical protein